MRALDRCDFCGGSAAGTFEVLPATLDPTEAEQRRVVLCDHCRSQLEDVLDPLLERIDVDTTETDQTTGTDTIAEKNTNDGEQSGDETGERRIGSDTPTGPSDDGLNTTDNESRERGETIAGTVMDESTPRTETRVQFDHDNASGERAIDTANESSELSESKETTANTDSKTDSGNSDDESDSNGGDSPTSGRRTQPAAAASVRRFLRNREFPMDRSDAELLAANAYDLEESTVERIIDDTIERGDILEDGDQLRRP